jgi:Ca2+/Na+ antiporter
MTTTSSPNSSTHTYQAIKRVDPVSVGKYLAGAYALIAIVAGLFFTVAGLVALATGDWEPLVTGLVIILFGTALYAGFGFVVGLVGGWIYNLVARRTGGIRIVLE